MINACPSVTADHGLAATTGVAPRLRNAGATASIRAPGRLGEGRASAAQSTIAAPGHQAQNADFVSIPGKYSL
ncbi:MAG: hypothetical protein LJE69_09195 [Thiohalocapsa sp.]|jgi:hypothetical protein|uniref:hypothetical protein n=1 Tax=Thiohalocapsa sp. TaxID=2497641 RepID=UPI0025E2F5D7|nr:hypothetical protein [Thiohalocapsa sp.]MCG6941414.1 hypothetical protein [Thiohalocapsa sp.]